MNFSEKQHMADDYFSTMATLTQRDMLWQLANKFGERGVVTAKVVIQLEEANTKSTEEQKDYIEQMLKQLEARLVASKYEDDITEQKSSNFDNHNKLNDQEKPMKLLF
ncbi:hypothetical protein ACTFQF_00895 [Aliivibrio fischeri]|nr:hypothetical protein [Aliivibrio fischeri]